MTRTGNGALVMEFRLQVVDHEAFGREDLVNHADQVMAELIDLEDTEPITDACVSLDSAAGLLTVGFAVLHAANFDGASELGTRLMHRAIEAAGGKARGPELETERVEAERSFEMVSA